MLILPIHTPLLRAGDDLAQILAASAALRDGDIVVLSSKAVATTDGAAVDLRTLRPSAEAETLAARPHRAVQPRDSLDSALMQLVLNETARMHGRIRNERPGVVLTELRPDGFPHGVLLVPNAGVDRSNIDPGFAVGWPHDPLASARRLRDALASDARRVAVIIGDSCCHMGRLGVTAFALTVCGIDPHHALMDTVDLFGRSFMFTQEAVADQLATAANAVMGNAAQSTPAAVIRDHGIPFTDFAGWVPGIEPDEDLFRHEK